VFDAGVHTLRSLSIPATTRLRPLAALLVAVLLTASAAQRASAGTYEVRPCETATHPGLAINDGAPLSGFRSIDRCESRGEIDESGGTSGSTGVDLVAPTGTTISSVALTRALSGSIDPLHSTGTLEWFTADENSPFGTLYDNVSIDDGSLPEGPKTYDTPGKSFHIEMKCADAPCVNESLSVVLTDISVTLDDGAAPAITKFTAPTAPVRGTATLSIAANDSGGGIFSYSLLVDGNTSRIVHLANDGNCTAPFELLVPCTTDLSIDTPFDTTAVQPSGDRLSDGTHTLELLLQDVGGDQRRSAPIPITLHNAPESTGAPAISGAPQVGATLTSSQGSWLGAPTLAYEWRRCPGDPRIPATTASCTPIAGATKSTYALTGDDLGHRIAVVVTATNFAGTEPALSQPTGVVAAAPVGQLPGDGSQGGTSGSGETSGSGGSAPLLSAPSLSRTRFRAGAGSRATLRLTSSAAGRLSIAIERALPGKRVRRGGKVVCAAVRRAPRSGRCTRYARAGTLAQAIGAGRDSIALSGRIGTRKLAPGSYRLTLTERDAAGRVSNPVRLTLTILPG
jgi:hypothetical protein